MFTDDFNKLEKPCHDYDLENFMPYSLQTKVYFSFIYADVL
ncbi:hypothetical protein PBAC_12420 [Pedobacter glucosidilyticus]|nr:hypothetical protein PBAC_12420 [Pedobacter glucosidilyticus]